MGVIFTGISFPFRRDDNSFPATATDDQLIQESLLQIIFTPRGSRIMRPDFGSNVLALVFEPNTEALGDLIRSDLSSSIGRFEPRVTVQNIAVTRKDSEVMITIQYTINATRLAGAVSASVTTSV